jgi:hypothetical protein
MRNSPNNSLRREEKKTASAVGTPVTGAPDAIPDMQFSRIRFFGSSVLRLYALIKRT